MKYTTEIEVCVKADKIELWYKHKLLFTLEAHGASPWFSLRPNSDSLRITEHPEIECNQLVIQISQFAKESELGLPRHRKHLARTETIDVRPKVLKPSYVSARERIADTTVSNILNDILDSMLKFPKQSKTQRAQITHEIASKRDVAVMAVAGVRAALARGVYGTLDDLLRQREHHQLRMREQ